MASRLFTPLRPLAQRRMLSTVSSGKPFPPLEQTVLKETLEAYHHAQGSTKMWANINLFLVVPILIASVVFILPPEVEHIKHKYEHPNEFVPFEHLRKLKNPYPWGFEPLFRNDAFVPLPPRDE
ncbi:Cytochrome c oxidase subunit 6A [Polyrhizophydium stewartii]|uniref:Cytochrome c oxidase subunit 6A n=1 Tax=Polyrhizophydium stewartii TaxID=2732419 RepID=A0ABR4NBX9_9FUNG|nr:hypothetical protein HK105_005473 [Polyrhizophydium stewartii]